MKENSAKEATFESLLQRLASIAESLSKDTDGLEVALARYEEGLKLAKECLSRLESAEQRVIDLKDSLESEVLNAAGSSALNSGSNLS